MKPDPSNLTMRKSTSLADRIEKPVVAAVFAAGWSSIILVAAILFFIVWNCAPLLSHLDWGGIFGSTHWHPANEPPEYGIVAMLAGNAAVAILAMVFALPFGLGAAVYISEFAGPRSKEWLKVGIETLAAIPSIVWGFIGVTIIGPILIGWGAEMGTNLLNGAIVLGLMSVPLVVSLSEDALRAVPDSYREAALALGANKWESVYRVLFPAAKNGLLAACMLGVGRAVGETMAVLLCTGNQNLIPTSLFSPIKTLTSTIASEMGDAEVGRPSAQILFFLGLVLLVITGAINIIANFVIRGKKS